MTPFGEILRRAVEATPGAIGGAFADAQGEMVDGYAKLHRADDWAILTAHYGVILAHLHAAFGIWHYGGPEYFIAQHQQLGIVVYVVEGGYYALLAIQHPTAPSQGLERIPRAPGGTYRGHSAWSDRAVAALSSLRTAATELRKEMA